MDDTLENIRDAAEEVHDILGPGCSESTYHRALEHEFSNQQIPFSSEGTISIFYKGLPVGKRRPDMFVENGDGEIVVELKAGSDRGEGQMLNYVSILSEDKNYDITNGILIRFNDELEITTSKNE